MSARGLGDDYRATPARTRTRGYRQSLRRTSRGQKLSKRFFSPPDLYPVTSKTQVMCTRITQWVRAPRVRIISDDDV